MQIIYRTLAGAQVLRTQTHSLQPTGALDEAEKDVDIAALSLSAIQRAASLCVLDKNYKLAHQALSQMMQLLERIATTDVQQEEFDIFVEKSDELEAALKPLTSTSLSSFSLSVSDATAKCFYFYQHAPLALFLAGARKDIRNRKKHVGQLKKLNI